MVSPKYVLKFLFLFTFILVSSQSFSETITFKGLVLSDFSKRIEIHDMYIKNNVMIMKHLEQGVLIKSKSQLDFKPGSLHIMFIDLTKSLKKSKLQKVKFNFKNAGSIVVNMPIMDKRKKSNEKKKHHHH